MILPAIAGLERLGDRALILDALRHFAGTAAERGRVVQALVVLDGVIRQAEAIGRIDIADMARSDLAVWSIDDDPMTALAAYAICIEHERRRGDRRALVFSTTNAAEVAVGAGDWGAPLEQTARLLQEDLEPSDWMIVSEQLTIVALLRGEDAAADLIAQARSVAGDNKAFLDQLDDRLGFAAWIAGGATEAIRHWHHYAEWSFLNAPACYPRAARAALWAGDLDGAREDLRLLRDTGVHGKAIEASVLAIAAGVAALEGRVGEARTGFRDARARWKALRQEWYEALTCLDQVLLLGPDDPDAGSAAARAREVFERLGAKPFLARLEVATGAGVQSG